ncbi:MAG TPA: tetratricopeptide repeat protein, partial [Candidatus Nanopelagicales bacterium]|nr:tetratricopeptide repeat protein [Candidatus Nanopelagicales bacterium]
METRVDDPRPLMKQLVLYGRISEGEKLAREVKARAEAEGDKLLAAEAAHRLGECLHEGFRYEEAWRAFEEALTGRSGELGPDHVLTAVTRAHLAAVSWSRDRGVEARALARRAAPALAKEPQEEDRSEVAEGLKALASIERGAGKKEEARAMLRRTLGMLEKGGGREELEIASACVALAVEEQDAHRLAAARRLFERALEIRRGKFGEEHTYIGFCLSHLSALHIPDDFEGAKALATQALGMLERCMGPDSPSISTVLMTLGTIAVMQEQTEEGFAYFEKAIAIEEAFFGPNHPYLSATLSVVAMAHTGSGDVKGAEPLWRRVVDLTLPARETRLDALVTAINNLMVSLRSEERHQEILAFAEPLIEQFEADPTTPPEAMTALWNGAAEAHYRLKRAAKAEKLLKRAIVTAERRFGKEAEQLDPLLANLAQLLTSMGRK